MRITLPRLALLFVPLGAAVVACAAADASNFGDQSKLGAPNAANDESSSANDAASGADGGLQLRGSILCGVLESKCSPDDDGTKPPVAASCVEQRPDAGSDGAAPAPPGEGPDAGVVHACRIHPGAKDPDPTCVEKAIYDGVDGAECHVGADCAPGFDCVDGEKGAVCRRYCCSGSCDGQTSKNGGPTFCDIQKPVDANPLLAPFCMPIKTCELMSAGQCGDRETCGIVTDNGDTSCVPKGAAKAGEACDNVHCMGGLTCLGSPNNRRCYQLCRTDAAECATGQTCRTGTVFQDPSFGVCKDDVSQ